MDRTLVPLLNWINLSTPCGLALAALSGCRVTAGPRGILLAEGYRRRLPKARAFTVGSVVLLRGTVPHDPPAGFTRLLEHEARHTGQYAACLGLPFLPAYLAAAAYSLLRTGDPASRNLFERGAGLSDGGYRERPPRPLAGSVRAAVSSFAGRTRRR
ncbi:eCIS core domain-containing protein [Arthrobacter sp. MDT1-65]